MWGEKHDRIYKKILKRKSNEGELLLKDIRIYFKPA